MVRKDERKRGAYEWRLRRLMNAYRSTGMVGDVRPRDARHALQLAKARAAKE